MKKLLFIFLYVALSEFVFAQAMVTTRRVKTDTLTSLSGNGIDLKDKIVNSTGNIEFDGWLQADSGVTISGNVQIGTTSPDSSVTVTGGVHIIGGLKVDGQVALEDSVVTLPADTLATRKYAREHGADGYFDSTYVYQEIDKLNTRVDSVIVEVETLNGRSDSLITAINSVNGRADSLITAVESLNTRADSIITAVESVNTRADSLITAVETVNTRIDSLIVGLDNLNTRADSIITGLGNLNTRVDSILINVIPRLDTRIDSVIANVTGGFDSTFVYQEIDKLNGRADSLITGVNAKLGIADSGSTPGVAGKYWTPTMEANATRHLRVTIIDPNAAYGKDSCICIWNKTSVAIVITNLEVSCGADPTTEPTGDIKYADAFIGRANPVVINDFDTTNGVRSDSSITVGDVPSGKCIFIRFDAEPEAAMTQITFDISYHY